MPYAKLEDRRAQQTRWAKAHPEYMQSYARKWRKENLLKSKARLRESHLRRKYGFSVEDFDTTLRNQNFRCGACFGLLKEGAETHIDHDHSTGRVRAILCRGCNLALGFVGDSPDRLEKLALYLRAHRAAG